MAGPSDLFDFAAEWLTTCADAVATTVGGAIDRSYVSPGPPAWDCCPQLTVHVGGPSEGDTAPLAPPLQPGHRTRQVGIVPLVPLTATVIRCVPITDGNTPPTAAVLEAAAQEVDEDVWAIWAMTRQRFEEGTLFPSPSGSRELIFQPALVSAPEGGCAGWQIPVQVAIGGYRPE